MSDTQGMVMVPWRTAYEARRWQPGRLYAGMFRDGRLVKVGFSLDVERRLKDLALLFGEPLKLIHDIPAYWQQERWLHRFLGKRHRVPVCGSRETYTYAAVKPELDAIWWTGETPAMPHIIEMIGEGLITVPSERCR